MVIEDNKLVVAGAIARDSLGGNALGDPIAGAPEVATPLRIIGAADVTKEALAGARYAVSELGAKNGYGITKLEDGTFAVVGGRSARDFLKYFWKIPILDNERMDGFVVKMQEAGQTMTIDMPEVDRFLIVGLTSYSGGQVYASDSSGEASWRKASGHALQLEGKTVQFSEVKSGSAVVAIFYRYASRKPDTIIEEARRCGFYPWQPKERQMQAPSGAPQEEDILPGGVLGSLAVERYRLRAAQEADEQTMPHLVLQEQGVQETRRKYGRQQTDVLVKEVDTHNYTVVDGLLSRRIRRKHGDVYSVPVIPDGGVRAVEFNGQKRILTWRNWILHLLHNTAAGAHIGDEKLEERVMEVAWWPGLNKDCAEWTRKCVVCKAVKGQPIGSAWWRSERYTAPFRVLQMDLIGEIVPQTAEGYNFVLTVVDCFTTWLWLVPLVGKSSAAVAEAFFLHIVLDLAGFPVILRSDRGSDFTGELMQELNRLMGTTQIFASAYHPQGQSLIEGLHKPLNEILAAFVDKYDDWAVKLPIARWAWNTT